VCCAKCVVSTFFTPWKSTETALLSQGPHLVHPACEHFVGVGLVAHIPNQTVLGCVEDIVQGNGEFDSAQIRAEVSAGLRDGLNQPLAQFNRQVWQAIARQLSQLRWRLNPFQQGVHDEPDEVIDRPVIYPDLTNRQVKLTLCIYLELTLRQGWVPDRPQRPCTQHSKTTVSCAHACAKPQTTRLYG